MIMSITDDHFIINGITYSGDEEIISIDKIIEIVKCNAGSKGWGACKLYDGAVFYLYLDFPHLSVGWGDRFIQPLITNNEIFTEIDYNKLWTKCCNEDHRIYLGKITKKLEMYILQYIPAEALMLKTRQADGAPEGK